MNAWIFMSVFLLQMLIVFLCSKSAWTRSHIPSDVKRSKPEQLTGQLGNAVWLLAMVYSIFLPLKTGTPWFWIGLAAFGLGLIGLALSTYNFIAAPEDRIIDRGVYRLSRHPMYFSSFFIYFSTGIAAGSWLFLLLSLVMVFCFNLEARAEENHCLQRYGILYQEYMRRKARWFGIPGKTHG